MKTVWMVFAMLTVSKLIIEVRLATKICKKQIYAWRIVRNPSCIDVSYKSTPMFSTNMRYCKGICDCHKMVVTVMKTHYEKQKAKSFNT